MTGEWIEAPGSAGAVFLFWHFLMLGLCITGLLLERILRRRNAHARSALLRSTLALALAIPLACTIWSALPARVAPLKVTVEDAGSTSQALPRFPEVDWNQVAVWRPLVTDIEQVPQNLLPIKTAGIPLTTIAYALFLGSSVLASLYLFGRFIAAVARCAALRHLGKPLAAADEERYRCVAAAMGVSAPPALTVKGLESPILLGFFRPAILLPEGMALRDEIFSHELTHLRRHDLMWHLLARITTMLMPLQPGFWLLKKALERADEDVCDDAVLVHGADAANYARLLLHVAESQHAPNPDLCLPMAAFRSQLERRLNRLLDATRPLARRLSVSVLCLGLGPLLAAGVLACAIFLDSERSVAADVATTTTLPPGKPTASSADSPTQAALTSELETRQKQLLDAQTDWNRRQVLYDSTKTLSDSQFVDTLRGLQHAPMDLTTVQDKISEMESARKDLLKQGYAANHPRIQSIDSELSQLQLRYASLIAGAHNALKIDADMGAAGVKVLQERIAELKTALNGRPTTDTGPTPSQLFHLEVANSSAKTGPGTLEFTDPGNSDATSLSLYKPLLNKYAWAAKYSTPLASPSPQPDYSNWLAHADPNEKDAMAAAFKAVDDWHAAIDSPNASANTAPQTISGQSVTAEDWQAYLAGPYSKWGPVQSRRLHMMMRGWVDGAKADAITNLTLVYEIKHLSPSGVITVLEDLKLSRSPDHPWHVDDYVSAATAISQPAPDHVESPPLIRSIDVEFVGKADEATKSKVLAASGLEVGSPYTVIRARRALRQIFATELLTNAAIKMTPLPDGVQVILVVQPNPTITEVSFEGIPADEQARLAARVHLHTQKGAMGSDYLAFQDAQAITSELAAEGLHLAAKGSTKLLDLAQGTASVTFTIAPPLP